MDATNQKQRLKQYIARADGATPLEASEICVDATADPELFVFSELLHAPSIAALQGTPGEKYHRLVRLFAHGTIVDYNSIIAQLPPLSNAHQSKLRLLSLLSLSRSRSRLPYDVIHNVLQLDDESHVETVVRDAVYAGLIRARIHQRERFVDISFVAGRDVPTPFGIEEMVCVLREWTTRTSQLVDEIDKNVAYIGTQTKLAAEHEASCAAKLELLRGNISKNGSGVQARHDHDGDHDFDFIDRIASSARHSGHRRHTWSRVNT